MAMTLLGVGAFMVGVVALATLLGAAVLAWGAGNDRPASTAPTLGIAACVLWLSTTGLVVPPGSWAGVASLGVAAVTLVAVTGLRRPDRLRESLGLRVDSIAPIVVGFVCASPFLGIMARARSASLVHLSGNHDGFFFTAVPEWLRGNTLIGAPGMTPGGTPEGVSLIGSTWDIVQGGSWRVGSDAFVAAMSRIASIDPVVAWFPMTLVYLVLVATAAHALCKSSGLGNPVALAVVGTVTTSAAVMQAVVDQHTPTLLALAAAMILVAEASRGPVRAPSGASPMIVAITAATVGAVYTELLALVALPVIALVVVPWWRQRSVDWQWLGAVVGWTVLVAAAPWWRVLLGADGGNSPEGFHSAFDAGSGAFQALQALARGTSEVQSWSGASWPGRAIVVVFVGVLVAGIVAVCRSGPARAFWAMLVATLLVGWWVLDFATYSGYPQQRFVEWSVPLLMVGSSIGWVTVVGPAIERLLGGSGTNRRLRATGLVVLAVALLAVPGVREATMLEDNPSRRVDRDVTMPAEWVHGRDPSGAATIVYAADYFTNLWTPYVLRHRPGTAYLTLYQDYYRLNHFGTLAGRRWLLLDRQALDGAQIPHGATVASNPRFSLVDLDVGPVILDVPPRFRGRWSAEGKTVTVRLDQGEVDCRAGIRRVACL